MEVGVELVLVDVVVRCMSKGITVPRGISRCTAAACANARSRSRKSGLALLVEVVRATKRRELPSKPFISIPVSHSSAKPTLW